MDEIQASHNVLFHEIKKGISVRTIMNICSKTLSVSFKIEALLEENKMELKRVLAENDKGDPFLEELRGTFVTTGLIQGF